MAPKAGSFTAVVGATSDTLRVEHAATSESGDRYRARFTNVLDSVDTDIATLTVTPESGVEPSPSPEPSPLPETPPTAPQTPPGSGAVLGVVSNASSAGGSPGVLRLDGLVLSPLDDRSTDLHYHGHWRKLSEPQAWQGTVTLGGAGASLTVHLAAGRPVLIIRDVHRRGRIAVIVGSHREALTLAASSGTASRTVIGARRKTAGTVQVRVLSGTIGIDGLAVTS